MLVTSVSCAKTAEPIEVSFWRVDPCGIRRFKCGPGPRTRRGTSGGIIILGIPGRSWPIFSTLVARGQPRCGLWLYQYGVATSCRYDNGFCRRTPAEDDSTLGIEANMSDLDGSVSLTYSDSSETSPAGREAKQTYEHRSDGASVENISNSLGTFITPV